MRSTESVLAEAQVGLDPKLQSSTTIQMQGQSIHRPIQRKLQTVVRVALSTVAPRSRRALRLWIPPAKRTQPVDSLLAGPHSGSRFMVPGSTTERSSALSIGTTVDASPAKVGCRHHSRPPVGFPFNTTCLHSILLIHSSIPCATHTSFVRTLSFEWPEQRRTRAS